MRQFVLLAHDVPLDGEFSLDDLAGGAGRLDAICRSITAAFVTSHGIRTDVRVHLVIQDTCTITFDGADLRRLNPDERSTAALVRNALEVREEAIGMLPAEASPGVELYRYGLETVLENVVDGTLIQLHEDGESIPSLELSALSDPVFVLSDHHDFTAREATLLEERADLRIRLGPTRLHADQAITVAHHAFDTEGYTHF
ncbi:tRNA (pseudouridine(54)-N(1))-methyltransferase TrmY [Natrialbaceae archaeon A-CW2]|uniref:tRNA (pseudouridine(54)-N(1))-methyltransferase TrmY n=1 Tax=Natronosalvus amylolyticus TaxID=2961994 RepID=UPI0020CA0219|nr:tRNA (pseudouridine(54)-N(1))-methyltransferase TrmY [Natronosalvus amylolyticus]